MNKTLSKAGRGILKGLLVQCTDEQQMLFKRMYCLNKDYKTPIFDVVDQMDDTKISTAISQCERTLDKNNKNEEQSNK